MDACTIAALDVITAFAVPNPNSPSLSGRFFQVWSPSELPLWLITQPTSVATVTFTAVPFSRRRRQHYNRGNAGSTPMIGAYSVDSRTVLWGKWTDAGNCVKSGTCD